jgi:very-short-patch-repair endonuclease/predicted transcriptional regulator of viral defense system
MATAKPGDCSGYHLPTSAPRPLARPQAGIPSPSAMALPRRDGHRSLMNRDQEDRLAALAGAQHGVVTRRQLGGLGLSPRSVERLSARGRLRRVHRGVYQVGPLAGPWAAEMAAVLAVGRDARTSHESAAWMWRVVPGHDRTSPVDLVVVGGGASARPGIRLHRVACLQRDERAVVDGVPTTSVARTLLDLATRLGRRDLEQAVGRAERERLVRLDDLRALLGRHPCRRGAAALRALLDDEADPAVTDSRAEERFLAYWRDTGLIQPKVNASVGSYRLDFYWPDHAIAIEIDGYRHHGTRPRFEGDRARTTYLAGRGIQVIPVTWRHLTRHPARTIAQIIRALAFAERR